MALSIVKFHEKAITLYGVSQVSEGTSAILSAAETTGTVTVAAAGTSVVGVGTLFLTEVSIGSYMYDSTGLEVGQVTAVADDLNLTVSAAVTAITAGTFALGLGAKNALAVTEMNYQTELDSETFVFTGDALSRDEDTVIKDKYAKFDFQVFLPKLGTIAGADPVETEVPLLDWMQSSGRAVVLSTDTSGTVTYTNSLSTNEYMTIEVRLSSPDIVTDKVYTMTDCRGMCDLDATVGTRATLKFDYLGNLKDVLQKASLVPDYQGQKSGHAESVKTSTISLSNLELYSGSVEPAAGLTNFCFDKIIAPNIDGFEYDRYQLSCIEGWSIGAVATDVTLTILEDEANATYNPDTHLEENHRLDVKWGSAAGSYVELVFHKIQLAGITTSSVAKYRGQELTYRNTGYVDIIIN